MKKSLIWSVAIVVSPGFVSSVINPTELQESKIVIGEVEGEPQPFRVPADHDPVSGMQGLMKGLSAVGSSGTVSSSFLGVATSGPTVLDYAPHDSEPQYLNFDSFQKAMKPDLEQS